MRVNITITVGASPINAVSKLSAALVPSSEPVYANRVFVQMLHGGAGLGYVMDGIPPGFTPNPATDDHITAELAPATATAPGGSYSDTVAVGTTGIDIRNFWVHGTNAGDKIKISYDLKV